MISYNKKVVVTKHFILIDEFLRSSVKDKEILLVAKILFFFV